MADSATLSFANTGNSGIQNEKVILIELLNSESAKDIIWHILDSSLVVSNKEKNTNIVTSLDTMKYADIVKARNDEEKTGHPIAIEGEIMINGRRYAQLVCSPTYTASSDRNIFCKSLEINISTRTLTDAELLDRNRITPDDNERSRIITSAESRPITHAIVTSRQLSESFQTLADYRTTSGIQSQVYLIEDILANFPGRDEAEQLRGFCKEFYANGGQYLLLGGDETILPVRYTTASFVTELPEIDHLQLCDLYFSDVDGDWDADNDGIWGERFGDQPDLDPDLMVGRLPFHTTEEVINYTNKLIGYETSPGGTDSDYLNNVFFFSSDQMRDYGTIGQHGYISEAFPARFRIDTVSGVEHSAGSDPYPSNMPASDLLETLSTGYGIINIIAHGRPDAFAVRTSRINNWPKSYFITEGASGSHGTFASLEKNNKVSFYYSLACDNAGFDQNQPPFSYRSENLATQLLALPEAGAIGFVGYSRWGWVGSSHLQQKAFFTALVENPELPAVSAMYASHKAVPYYRDLIYGQLFLGDPALHIYIDIPIKPTVTVTGTTSGIQISATNNGTPLDNMQITVSANNQMIANAKTGGNGIVDFNIDVVTADTLTIVAVNYSTTTVITKYITSLATDIIDDSHPLPKSIELYQNYPNPFNPSTTISFSLPERSDIDLSVFNLIGQNVATLVAENMTAGHHVVIWDGTDSNGDLVASGIYFYRIRAGSYTATKKMLVLK